MCNHYLALRIILKNKPLYFLFKFLKLDSSPKSKSYLGNPSLSIKLESRPLQFKKKYLPFFLPISSS